MSDWVPLKGVGAPRRHAAMTAAALGEFNHPVRGQLMLRLRTPRSAAELAEALDVPVTRLYHHLNRLREAGFIRPVASRRSGAKTELRYQIVAEQFTVDPKSVRPDDLAGTAAAIGTLFDLVRSEYQREILLTGAPSGRRRRPRNIVNVGQLHLTPVRQAEFVARLSSLIAEFDDPEAPGTGDFRTLLAAFPVSP